MRVDVSTNVFCKIIKINAKSVVFDVYKNAELVDTKEYFDNNKIDLQQVKQSMKNQFRNL